MIDRAKARKLNQEVADLLTKHFGKRYEIAVTGCSFNTEHIKPRVTISERPADGKSVRQVEFEKWASLFGLSKSDFGRRFVLNGTRYTVSGINLKARKRPILADSDGGTTFCFTRDSLQRVLKIRGLVKL